LMFSIEASAGAVANLLDTLGVTRLLTAVGETVGTIGVSVLNPVGTGDNDFLGVDALNSENDLGVTLLSGELLGFGNKTGSDTAIPLDALGLGRLVGALGLNYDSGIVTLLRGLVGPEGVIVSPLVGVLDGLTNTLSGVGQALTLPSLNNGLLGLSLLGGENTGNDGLIGLSILSGDNTGNGKLIGISLLSGDDSGNGGLAGVSLLSGSNSGNSDNLGVAVLSGDNAGNGGNLGVAALNGDNSGNSDFAGIAVLNGANSGNADTLAVGALNGDNSANGGLIGAGVLNGLGSGSGGLISVALLNESGAGIDGNDVSNCAAIGGVGCAGHQQLALLDVCEDLDADGVCDDRDECLDTPANAPVFLTGCHLTEDAPLVLRGVNFEFDRADLTPESLPVLEHAVKVLQAQPAALVAIDGHTDAKGSDEYNIRLSYARAATVYNYLIAAGIEEKRLAYRGYGESVPVASNENEDGSDNPIGRAENRRVELNILDGAEFLAVKEQNQSDN
jgi:outer membrane protein OmpA-like peptidoglycan-associated protein